MTTRAFGYVLVIVSMAACLPIHSAGGGFKELVPWRRIPLLANKDTQLLIEAEKGKIYKVPGGAKGYFLSNEKGGPAVNVCKAALQGHDLEIRCDRKGGFHDGPKPRAWWWRYQAVLDNGVVKITAVSQKDGPFESGEAVYNHFRDDIDDS